MLFFVCVCKTQFFDVLLLFKISIFLSIKFSENWAEDGGLIRLNRLFIALILFSIYVFSGSTWFDEK